MNILSQILSHTPPRLQQALKRDMPLTVGPHTLAVPSYKPGFKELRNWVPDWKTHLIGHLLQHFPGAFFDIGANSGQTLLDFLHSASDTNYVGFEPNIACCDLIGSVIAKNRLEDCKVIPVGIADSNGLKKFYVEKDAPVDAGASLIRNFQPQKALTENYISCVRLDEAWETLGEPQVGVVKIDVEGAENLVLHGARKILQKQGPAVILEVLMRNPSAPQEAYAARVEQTAKLIRDSHLNLFHILKSGDGKVILRKISRFPLEEWTFEKAEACDYLLLPKNRAPQELGFQVE